MRGIYGKNGEECLQVGILTLMEDGYVCGWVMDPTSSRPKEFVRGGLKSNGRKLKITIRISDLQSDMDIEYVLKKSDRKRKTIDGRYEGFWTALKPESGNFAGRDFARMTLDSKV